MAFRAQYERALARWTAAAAGVLLLLVTLAPVVSARARVKVVKADGRWHAFHVRAPDEAVPFRFEVRSGCRYRLTAQAKTLPRVLLAVGHAPERASLRADSRPPGASP